MLKTKCIKVPSVVDDGLRISVMSRHTLNDGITPDLEIVSGVTYHEWWPELGPDSRLIGEYYKRGLSWDGFEQRFRDRLGTLASSRRALDVLLELAHAGNVTILCVEPEPAHCHRRLVAEACRDIDPSLAVLIG
jgi:uncharacterized protein YeaO (DUF488 family)